MSKDKYIKTIDKIKASESFKKDTLLILEKEMNNNKGTVYKMKKKTNKAIGLVAACLVMVLGVIAFMPNASNDVDKPNDIADNTVIEEPQGTPMGKAVVNIEGKIIEVSDDGKSFKLDNGLWVKITDETELGITGPTAAPKEEQFFEETFRVGNSIAGFTLDEISNDRVTAYAIYTNWNWENPIKK